MKKWSFIILLIFILGCQKQEFNQIQVKYQGYGECTYRVFFWDGYNMVQSNTIEFEFLEVVYLLDSDTAKMQVIADHSNVNVWLLIDWNKLLYETVKQGDTCNIIYKLRQ